jgi:hypothetical protein
MIVAIHYCRKEQDQAKQLAAWIKELGPYPNHKLLVAVDNRAQKGLFNDIGFSSTEQIVITDDAWDSWPTSPNNAFRHIAKHIEYGSKEPWLWCEVDCVPLKKEWLDRIEAEYKEALARNKVFLGDFVHINEPGFLDHCSGVAVYPGLMSNHAGEALLAHELAWDVASASQILPQMHKSKLILHRWKYPAFQSWEQVKQRIFAVKPDCVLFHSDKRGSLIPLLRQNSLNETATEIIRSADVPKFIESWAATIPEKLTCDIFIKSFPGDYEWLEYCLRSIAKFATGFRNVVVIVPKMSMDGGIWPPGMGTVSVRIIDVEEPQNGYLFQQVCKLNADKYTDADFVLFMDSDCIFTRPVTPETFMRDGKIMWLMTPMDKAREDQRAAWISVMTKWMNKAPEYEFMHRHPFMFPRWFFEKIRGFCASQHSQALDNYILKQPGRAFSEFNCAGFLAYEHFRDRFEWINTATDQVPPATVLQNWSPAGLTEATKAELEAILKSEHPPTESFSSGTAIVSGVNGDTSRETLVRDAVAVLKRLCTSPVHTGRVRKELKAQGVIR